MRRNRLLDAYNRVRGLIFCAGVSCRQPAKFRPAFFRAQFPLQTAIGDRRIPALPLGNRLEGSNGLGILQASNCIASEYTVLAFLASCRPRDK